jgi:hypothetical protein
VTQSGDFTLADLERLAAARNFRIVHRGILFWVVRLRTGLPEVNGNGLVFTLLEARDMLLGLNTSSKPGQLH